MLVFRAICSFGMACLLATLTAGLHAQAVRFGGYQVVGAHDPFAWSIEAGDIDGDGDSDLVVGWEDGTISLYSNIDGRGEFLESTSFSSFDCPRLIVQDINMDSKCEVINNSCSSGIEIWEYDGDTGAFSAIFSFSQTFAYDIGFFELTGDSLYEFVQTIGTDGEVRVYSGREEGYSLDSSYLVPNALVFPTHTAAGDIDLDGDLDLVISGSDGDALWVENVDGIVNGPNTTIIDGANEYNIYSLSCVDIDNDEVVDVFLGEGSLDGSRYRWMENLDGTGHVFSPHLIMEDEYFTFYGVLGSGRLVDVDNNGELDLLAYKTIAGNPWTILLLVFPNLDFSSSQQENMELMSLSDELVSFNLVDLDGDGMLDMPSWSYSDSPVLGDVGWRKNVSNCDTPDIQIQIIGESVRLTWDGYGSGFQYEVHRKETAYAPLSDSTRIGTTFDNLWFDENALHDGTLYYQVSLICDD
jgi:hypothetical protein